MTHCPLCQQPLDQEEETQEPPTAQKIYPEEVKPPKRMRTTKQKRFLIWEILSVTLLTTLLIVLFLDLIISKTITWSLYPIASLVLAWIVITCPLLFPKKVAVIVPGETIPFFIYLLVIDLADNRKIDWYLRLGLPILCVIITVGLAIGIGSLFLKNKGLNIAALIVLGAGIICLGIDFIVSSYIYDRFTVNWSLYVLALTVVIGGFLLYLHFRLLKGANLKRKLRM